MQCAARSTVRTGTRIAGRSPGGSFPESIDVADPQAFDVIIAGGGMGGRSVGGARPAALARPGLRTLVVEPGLDSSKRLAGELIHPPGVANLAELGLLGSLEAAGGAPVLGFAGVGDGQYYRLPYASLGTLRLTGFAMEHAAIASTLRAAVARLPHVTVWDGARVVAVHLGAPEAVGVTISRRGDYTQLNARLVVAADGSASSTRGPARLRRRRRRLSSMLGFVLPGGRLPHPGF